MEHQRFRAHYPDEAKTQSALEGIQKSLEKSRSHFLENLEKDLTKELEEVCLQEELLWFQKSRSDWISLGDRNTAYYHAKAVKRRHRKIIFSLKDDAGMWYSDDATLRSMAVSFFKSLYTSSDDTL